MSVGIVRVQKMTAGSVKGIEIHDLRKKDVSHTNKDIDFTRMHLNYTLHQNQPENFNQAVKARIAELHLSKAVRKDAIVMAQVLVTSEHEFFEGMTSDQQKAFFRDSYNFLANRYGVENIISATVHMDERTPHMHFNFVPVTSAGRLSAKSILTRQSLIEQQTAFHAQVGELYGLPKEERLEKGVDRKNMTMPEYKAYTAELEQLRERVVKLFKTEDRLTAKIEQLKLDEQNATESVKSALGEVVGLQEKGNALEDKLESLESELDDLQVEIESYTKERNILKQVVQDEYRKEGGSIMGRIEALKEETERRKLLSVIERFIKLPVVQPLWEQFKQQEREQQRARNRNSRNRELER